MDRIETPRRPEVRVVNLTNSPQFAPHLCSICHLSYELGNEVSALRCGHIFHVRCLETWLDQVK